MSSMCLISLALRCCSTTNPRKLLSGVWATTKETRHIYKYEPQRAFDIMVFNVVHAKTNDRKTEVTTVHFRPFQAQRLPYHNKYMYDTTQHFLFLLLLLGLWWLVTMGTARWAGQVKSLKLAGLYLNAICLVKWVWRQGFGVWTDYILPEMIMFRILRQKEEWRADLIFSWRRKWY